MSSRHAHVATSWIAVLALALVGSVGCATRSIRILSPEDLRAEVLVLAPEASDFEAPFAVPPEAVAKVRADLRFTHSDLERARRLMETLTDPNGFGLRWTSAASGSARQTLARGEGNCLALSSVFVGLARELGLRARYAEIPGLGLERRRRRKLLITADHIGVVVRTDAGEFVGDFRGELGNVGRVRRIDDLEAVAHQFNNRGWEVLQDAQAPVPAPVWEEARKHFEFATQVAPGFARAWNNLGVAQTRLGDETAAAKSYRHAVVVDPRIGAAWRNLGNLEQRAGHSTLALELLDRAAEHDPENPWVHYDRGRVLAALGREEEAIQALEASLAIRGDFEAPKLLLEHLDSGQARVAGGDA